MKKLFIIFSFVLLVSGCSLMKIQDQTYEEIIQSVFTNDTKLENVFLEGYSYYLPKGVMLKKSNSLNSVLYYNHKKMYLYVDVLSYYHKKENTYEENQDSYYSQAIDINGKAGYLEITQISTKYFVEFMYHYSKIEAYVSETDLKKTITQMAYILGSVQFQDAVLNTLIGDNTLDYNEENFNIFKPKREEGNFLDYEEQYQYDDGNKNTADEDNIDLENREE